MGDSTDVKYGFTFTKLSLNRSQSTRQMERVEKSRAEQELCQKHQRLATLRGCGCPDCEPVFYSRPEQRFNPLKGLQYRRHDAWDLARMAVSSFNGEAPLSQIQILALDKWWPWLGSMDLARCETLDGYGLQTAIGLFNDVFFLGALPPSRLVANWADMSPSRLGSNYPSRFETKPETILLNCNHNRLQCSITLAFRTLLHEVRKARLHIADLLMGTD